LCSSRTLQNLTTPDRDFAVLDPRGEPPGALFGRRGLAVPQEETGERDFDEAPHRTPQRTQFGRNVQPAIMFAQPSVELFHLELDQRLDVGPVDPVEDLDLVDAIDEFGGEPVQKCCLGDVAQSLPAVSRRTAQQACPWLLLPLGLAA
jgi:hypothetical protein